MTTEVELNGVYRLKISGETVQVVDEAGESDLQVFRARPTRDGITYETITVPEAALESVKENIKREWDEATYRHDLINSVADKAERASVEILN